MEQLWQTIQNILATAQVRHWIDGAKIAIEILIIGYAVAWIWRRIRGTQAERLVKGVLFLFLLSLLSWAIGLTLITSLLQSLIHVAVVSLVIIFQPEIRRGLHYLGRTTFRFDWLLVDGGEQRTSQTVAQITTAVRQLSRDKIGALIVVEPPEGERDYLSPGTPINADVSSNLILSIFVPQSPLHDGALIIRSNKVVAAGVILPITDSPKLHYRYGTRHRAAIGLSEIYDGLCIVVSEETGSISAANRGMLVRYNAAEELTDPLSYFFHHGTSDTGGSALQSFLAMFGRQKQPAIRTATTRGAQTDVASNADTISQTETMEETANLTAAAEPADKGSLNSDATNPVEGAAVKPATAEAVEGATANTATVQKVESPGERGTM